jgi:hypothetical protein
MTIGLAEERAYQMLMYDRDAHIAWVDANAWKKPMAPRRRWRQDIARMLVALAARIAPPVATRSMSTQATNQ